MHNFLFFSRMDVAEFTSLRSRQPCWVESALTNGARSSRGEWMVCVVEDCLAHASTLRLVYILAEASRQCKAALESVMPDFL